MKRMVLEEFQREMLKRQIYAHKLACLLSKTCRHKFATKHKSVNRCMIHIHNCTPIDQLVA